jgi:hypothetical protein
MFDQDQAKFRCSYEAKFSDPVPPVGLALHGASVFALLHAET